MEMERRALELGGYDSDLEREEAVMQAQQPRVRPDPGDDGAAGTWRAQNAWMDFYRQRLGPDEGYEAAHLIGSEHAPRSTNSSPGPRYLVDYHSPIRGALSDQVWMVWGLGRWGGGSAFALVAELQAPHAWRRVEPVVHGLCPWAAWCVCVSAGPDVHGLRGVFVCLPDQ
eukprot:66346-Chlamydomonas_euryale.AAC.1